MDDSAFIADSHPAHLRSPAFLFVNPASGGYSQRRFESALQLLNAHGIRPAIFSVRTPDDVLSHCLLVNQADTPLVIIAAGDGTINCVVNGLEPENATIAILPFGTSNVLAAELGISSLEVGVTRIIAGTSRQLSVGVVETNDLIRRFVLMAGIGLDGAVVRDVWPPAKRFLKQGAYALSALCQVLDWDKKLFEVVLPQETFPCHSAIVSNGARYGGNFILAPHRTLFSDDFEVITIRNSNRRTYIKAALKLFSGRSADSVELVRCSAAYLEITGNRPIQVDGDFIGYGPARLKKLDNFAKIIL